MTRDNGKSCAVCKHQRKKCSRECIFAAYFPPDRTLDFDYVHKVFGVSNTVKLLRDVEPEQRENVINSLVWEATMWQEDRVHGPLGAYRRLEEEVRLLKEQLALTNQRATLAAPALNPKPQQEIFRNSNLEWGSTNDYDQYFANLNSPNHRFTRLLNESVPQPVRATATTASETRMSRNICHRYVNVGAFDHPGNVGRVHMQSIPDENRGVESYVESTRFHDWPKRHEEGWLGQVQVQEWFLNQERVHDIADVSQQHPSYVRQ